MSEATAHLSLVDFLDRHAERLPALAFVFHVANESAGGAKSKSGVPLDVLKEARMGAQSGVWDFMLLLPGGGLALELKSDAAYRKAYNDLSPAQRRWRAHYEACGWTTYVYPESRWHEAALRLVAACGGDPNDYQFS